MKKGTIFALGLLCGLAIGQACMVMMSGAGSNSGSEFYGSEYTDLLRGGSKGMGCNSGSKFFGDLYIKEVMGKKAPVGGDKE